MPELRSVVSVPLGVISKIVPQPYGGQLAPPWTVVPYKFPSVAWTNAAWGALPFVS